MSSFGRYFLVSTFGESHSRAVGCIIDNVPPNLDLCEKDIQPQLERRRPGFTQRQRREKDVVIILSGIEGGKTLGTPVSLLIYNEDPRPEDYQEFLSKNIPRPSHADFTYLKKYGIKASSGGGRSSARETVARVAAGSVAEKWLRDTYRIEIVAFVSSVGEICVEYDDVLLSNITREDVDRSGPVRCTNFAIGLKMNQLIEKCQEEADSIGGSVACVVRNCPIGWGEPCFDKLEAKLSHAMLSIPAAKAFELGSGFNGCALRGSVHNDLFVKMAGSPHLRTSTNHSGGIQGGISNGMPIYFRVGFKPPATIGKEQLTSDFSGELTILNARGRHDACVVPRAVPIVEAMTALVLADAALAQEARRNAANIAI